MGSLSLFAPVAAARIERDPVEIYLAGQSLTGRRSMRQKLKTAAAILGYASLREIDWRNLRFEHVTTIRSELIEQKRAPATVNATLAAVRGAARAAWSLNLISGDTFNRIASVKGVRASKLPSGRILTAGEVAGLFEVCFNDNAPAGRRDAAILALLLGAGLRRAECADLMLGNYSPDEQTLTVKGKGDKQRLMPLGLSVAGLLAEWLEVRGLQPGPLLCAVRKDGAITVQSITAQTIYKALAKRAEQAHVARFSPHDLRKTYASALIDLSGDISTVSRLLGHANIQTTAIYDRRGEIAKRRVVECLHLPYRPRPGVVGVRVCR